MHIEVQLSIHNSAGLNQAQHLASVVGKHIQTLAEIKRAFEIILLPNGCTDNSDAIWLEIQDRNTNVSVVSIPTGGWGLAVREGLKEAKGDIICYTNLARTIPQDLCLMVLYGLTNRKSVIKANRKIRENWMRRLGSLVYNIQCRHIYDLSYWDINGTSKVFLRCYERLLQLTRNDDLIDLEFHIICRQKQYP